jgi:hypothetical protein
MPIHDISPMLYLSAAMVLLAFLSFSEDDRTI